jgi:hypothetical protein
MNSGHITRILGVSALLWSVVPAPSSRAADAPAPRLNVVYLLADDLGWGEPDWHRRSP